MYRALLVCNSTYPADPGNLIELRGARVDGLHMWNALTDASYGLFLAGDVEVLFERTSKEIVSEVEEFFQAATRQDTVLLYFSGHGRRYRQELYLCARDTISRKLASSAVSTHQLKTIIESCLADVVVVVLDCCFSGSYKGSEELGSALAGAGTFVLASSRANELSADSDSTRSPSPFTETITLGLRGAADNGNSCAIDLDNLYDYVYESVSRSSPVPQRKFDGSGSIIIARRARDVPAGEQSPPTSTNAAVSDTPPSPMLVQTPLANQSADGLSLADLHPRTKGDYSKDDLRSWMLRGCAALLVLALVVWTFTLQAEAAAYTSSRRDGWLMQAAGAAGILLALFSILEGVASLRGAKAPVSRRSYSAFLRNRFYLVSARSADVVALIFTAVLCISPVTGFFILQIPWIMAVSLLSCIAASSLTRISGYGSANFLGGITVVLACPFIPLTKSLDMPVGYTLGVSIIGFLAVGGWYVRSSTITIITASAILLILSTLLVGIQVPNGYVGLAGAIYAIVAILMGTGEAIPDIPPLADTRLS